MAFGRNLSALLEARGWKAVNLAAALSDSGVEVAVPVIDRWLRGVHEPRLSTACAVATVLGVPIDELSKRAPVGAGAGASAAAPAG